MNVAILGVGTVGESVAKILLKNKKHNPAAGTLFGKSYGNLPETFWGQGSRSDKQEDTQLCAECGLKIK